MNTKKGILKGKEKEIAQLYIDKNMDIVSIAQLYTVNSSSICRLLIRNGVPIKDSSIVRKKYKVNSTYFNIIDSEEKAYFLGFLYADGSLASTFGRYTIAIALQERDKYILEKFRDNVESNRPLEFISSKKKKGILQNQYKLSIDDKKMHSDLCSLGCVPNKTFVLRFPSNQQVPEKYIRHFIRGYFDGDGCVFRHKNRQGVNFLGTKELLSSIKSILEKECEVSLPHVLATRNIFSYSIKSEEGVFKFYDYIYKDSTIFLKRKKEKFHELFNHKRREIT